jgi:ketosteroid isomerase-like protein
MTRAWPLWAAALMLTVGTTWPSEIEGLVAAEHRFAEAAAEDGMRDAFLGVLAEDGIVFRPGPVNGREWFETQEPPPGLLAWTPVHAEVSSAGDLGYTTGPWRYELEGREPAFGHYVSIWGRTADDGWQLLIDHGISHAEPEQSAWDPAIASSDSGETARELPSRRLAALERKLAEADRALSRAATENGPAEAYAQVGVAEIRLYRDGGFPVVGLEAVREALEGAPAPRLAETMAVRVAASGDLGYSYGTSREGGDDLGDSFCYMRIWETGDDGGWRIVLDILTVVP